MDADKFQQVVDTLADINSRLDSMASADARNVTPQGKLRNQQVIGKDRRTEDILRTTQHELEIEKHDHITSAKQYQNIRAFTTGLLSDQVDQDIRVEQRVALAISHLDTFDKHVNQTASSGKFQKLERIMLIAAIAFIVCIAIIAVIQPQVLTPIEGWVSPAPTQQCLNLAQNAGYGVSNSTLAQQMVDNADNRCASQANTLGYEHQGLAVGVPIFLIITGIFLYRRWRR